VAGVDAGEAATIAGHLGKYDLSFVLGEPERYRQDVPNAEVHVLDAGHFALDTAEDESMHGWEVYGRFALRVEDSACWLRSS